MPTGDYSQKAVAGVVNGLAGAHLDCKEKLSGVVSIVDKAEASARAKLSERK